MLDDSALPKSVLLKRSSMKKTRSIARRRVALCLDCINSFRRIVWMSGLSAVGVGWLAWMRINCYIILVEFS